MIEISQQEHERFIRGELSEMQRHLKVIAISAVLITAAALFAAVKYSMG
jgi:hypothetical protein